MKTPKWLIKGIKIFATCLFVLMVALVILQVAVRHFLPIDANWTVDGSRYLFVIVVFFGSIVAFFEREHIAIETLINRLPAKYLPYVKLIEDIAIFIFIFMGMKGGIRVTKNAWGVNAGALEFIGIHKGELYLMVMIGLGLFAIVVLLDFIDKIETILRKTYLGKDRGEI